MQEMINSSITSPVSRILLRNQPSDSLGECFSYLIASLDALRSLTHTVLLLDELHQLLQDFIQNPADTNTGQEARSAGTGPFLLPGELSASPRGQQKHRHVQAGNMQCTHTGMHADTLVHTGAVKGDVEQ